MPNVENPKLGDIDVIIEIDLNEANDKIVNSCPLPLSKESQNMGKGRRDLQKPILHIFRERESNFSLSLRAIRPSEFFGARSKAALRSEAYAWAPILGSFNKLREVGDLSYLGFTLYLSIL